MNLDPNTIIVALAAAVTTLFTTLGGLLLKGWQERVKRGEEAERNTTAALLKDREEWRDRAQYLEDQRAELTRRLLEIRASQMPGPEPKRSQSPRPGTYSTQTTETTKTRRS